MVIYDLNESATFNELEEAPIGRRKYLTDERPSTAHPRVSNSFVRQPSIEETSFSNRTMSEDKKNLRQLTGINDEDDAFFALMKTRIKENVSPNVSAKYLGSPGLSHKSSKGSTFIYGN